MTTEHSIRLEAAINNYKAAMAVYCRIFTTEQWRVVCNAYDAVTAIGSEKYSTVK